jgi:polyisoprenoid-binding protein YceI
VNNVVFLMDAPLESINGTATGVSGTVSFDPAKPAATTGKIVLATSSLHVDNPLMKKHMLDEGWMHVSKFPTIEFVAGKITKVKTSGTTIIGTIAGELTVKGVTKKVSVPVRLTYLKGMLIKRNRVPGDLLVLRCDFIIKRSDYGINAGNNEEKVSDEIELKLRVAGAAPY